MSIFLERGGFYRTFTLVHRIHTYLTPPGQLVQMKLLVELSGEHPSLPFAELDCIGRVIAAGQQVAVLECPDPTLTRRLSLTHAVLEYIGECRAGKDEVAELLTDLSLSTEGTFAVRVRKVFGNKMEASSKELEALIGAHVTGNVSLSHPGTVFRLIVSGDRCYFGRLLFPVDRGSFELRNPGKREFFHPGVMMPRIARALVNIACVRPGEVMLDPFCGTGGMLIEARLVGAVAIGSDMDFFMVSGSRRNLTSADLLLADAASLPLRDESVDAVVTDMPYGQSVSILGESMECLYLDVLGEIRRVLKPGRRAVLVTHRDISPLVEGYLKIEQFHEQRVHKSLTRRILVLKKT